MRKQEGDQFMFYIAPTQVIEYKFSASGAETMKHLDKRICTETALLRKKFIEGIKVQYQMD